LPTLGVFTESRKILIELKLTILSILSAASDHKYSKEELIRKISFTMHDSTAHNLKVLEGACEELGVVDKIPGTLVSNFINSDYSAKPWNRYSHFSDFIKPKKNYSLSLKDHRFNRLK